MGYERGFMIGKIQLERGFGNFRTKGKKREKKLIFIEKLYWNLDWTIDDLKFHVRLRSMCYIHCWNADTLWDSNLHVYFGYFICFRTFIYLIRFFLYFLPLCMNAVIILLRHLRRNSNFFSSFLNDI